MRLIAAFVLVLAIAMSSALPVGAADDQKPLNDMVRAQLAQQGDNGKTAREVDHFAFPNPFKKSAKRLVVKKWLEKNGFAIVGNATSGGVHFTRKTAVHGRSFDKLTQGLADNLQKLGWEYDGWGTIAVKGALK